MKVVPDAAPAPPLLNVTEFATLEEEPLKVAVIVPALKFPDASRRTKVFTVFALSCWMAFIDSDAVSTIPLLKYTAPLSPFLMQTSTQVEGMSSELVWATTLKFAGKDVKVEPIGRM